MRPTSGGSALRRTAGVRDAKARLSQLLRDVQLGQEWLITERGKPIARLVPISQDRAPLEERLRRLEDAGLIERAAQRVLPLPPPLPLERGLAGRMLDEDRRA
jgi:prevent-host-death family protein